MAKNEKKTNGARYRRSAAYVKELVDYIPALADAQISLQPPVSGGRRLKIYYATQQSVCPPTFVLFINNEELMHFAYQRYLENHFRKCFGFEGTPIRFILREKKQDGKN